MSYDFAADDERMDPRVKGFLSAIPLAADNVIETREQTLQSTAIYQDKGKVFDMFDDEEFAPSAGLKVSAELLFPRSKETKSTCASRGQTQMKSYPAFFTFMAVEWHLRHAFGFNIVHGAGPSRQTVSL